MSSHITIVPASTHAGKETIRVLLASESKPFVRGIYRDPSKAPAEFTALPNFEAVKGDVSTGAGLDFKNSKAVFYVPPPTYDGTEQGEFAKKAAENVKTAIQKAPSVVRLVLHSAMGAQHDHSIGVLRLNHITDNILKSVVSEVRIVKPGYYFEEWAYALKTMQADPPSFVSTISPSDHKIPMVSVKDVGEYCATALLDRSAWPSLEYLQLFGPRLYSTLDMKHAIEDVTGKKGKVITIERDELTAYFASQLPEMYAQDFADMMIALMPGGIIVDDFVYDDHTVKGKLELGEVIRQMASR